MQTEERFLDFGFENWPAYLNSPVRHVVEQRKFCRWHLDDGEPLPFPVLEEHRSAGYVDSDCSHDFFRWEGQRGLMGYRPARRLQRSGSPAVRRNTPNLFDGCGGEEFRRFTTNVLSTYVGREPGELIMKGQIRREDVRTIKAALTMVDLRDFTGLSDAFPPSEVIETLNRSSTGHSAHQKAWWRAP